MQTRVEESASAQPDWRGIGRCVCVGARAQSTQQPLDARSALLQFQSEVSMMLNETFLEYSSAQGLGNFRGWKIDAFQPCTQDQWTYTFCHGQQLSGISIPFGSLPAAMIGKRLAQASTSASQHRP